MGLDIKQRSIVRAELIATAKTAFWSALAVLVAALLAECLK
jgi:hypothetical protein